MNDLKIARVTGLFGIACVALTFGQFPLWLVGTAPSVYDGRGFAQHLFEIKNVAFTRILMDQGIYVSMLIFAAGLRHLIRQARAETEWIGTLLFGAALGWVAVTVVADGLEGGAVLDTLNGKADASTVRALIAATLLIYNGSIAFAITGLFLAAAAWATFDSDVLPRWTGWIAVTGAVLCAASVPAMYGGPVDYSGFYNAGGWGPAIVANFPPMIWFLVVSVILIRRGQLAEARAEPIRAAHGRFPNGLLIACVASVVVYGLGDLVSGLLYSGYSFKDQWISELSAFGSPVRPLMVTAILVHGLLLLVFGVGFWRSADRRILRWLGVFLMLAGLIGFPTHTVFAMSSRWMTAGLNDTMHAMLSLTFSVVVFTAVVLSGVAFPGWFRLYAIATIPVLVGFGAASAVSIQGIAQNSTPWAGAFERINAYAYFAWLIVLAVIVTRRSLHRLLDVTREMAESRAGSERQHARELGSLACSE